MLIKKKFIPLFRGLTATMFSLAILSSIGYGIANTWRGTVDSALGTTSYETDVSSAKYTSDYKTAKEVMDELKAVSVQEGVEGTAILKNDNSALPLQKDVTINLWGSASYNPYRGMNQAKNEDAVDLVAALKNHGFKLDSSLETIYKTIFEKNQITQGGGFGRPSGTISAYPNLSAPSYGDYKIMEVNPDKFSQENFGAADANWANKLTGSVNIVTFERPGGEGTTYKPGATQDEDGNALDQNPLAFSPAELAVIDAARATGKPTIVLLNTSCQFELGPIVKGGAHEVDGIAYIGIPNDYQFTGIVEVLAGDVNATGALADTYAISSTSSPSMQNFGGDVYSDYTLAATGANEDARWPDGVSNEMSTSSFGGGAATYNGSGYYVEAEGIYTGYHYYETRFFDSVVNDSYNAKSTTGSIDGAAWNYSKEVAYPFGYGLSYLDYNEELVELVVDKSVNGNVKATVRVTNNSSKDGLFRAELYVNAPYTQYDRENKVEKSAIQFLNSAKVEVKAGQSQNVTIEVPTKYLASYDYTKAKTYVLDGGDYYFAIGNGSHEATNNVITQMGKTGDMAGSSSKVKVWNNGSEADTDTVTFSKSKSGAQITNHLDSSDLNYYLPDTVTYLSRSNWSETYPKNYNAINGGKGVSIASSSKKDEWISNMRNEQRLVKTNDPVKNFDGEKNGLTWENMPASAVENIYDPWWDNYVAQIPAEEAVGAVAHGGSQSDILTNLENPVVKQFDGPAGFNNKKMSENNKDVDPETEEGKFKGNVHSQTLEGSSFNPELAYRWGRALGNFGLWAQVYNIWAGGLNVHRNPYNGRNIEYLSEDSMLTNIMGREFLKATLEKGLLVGPKHVGFNDQEYNRAGVAVYLNEQKARETDLRGFEGSIEDAGALAYMCAFNRLGATNVAHYKELHVDLIREEWGFKGLITTDMMSNKYYFNPESCINATITQMADFGGENSHLNLGTDGNDATWTYLSPDAIKNDNALVEQARQNMKYQLFAFSQTAIKNIKTYRVTPWWETTLVAMVATFYVLAAAATCFLAIAYVPSKAQKEEK